MTHNNCTSNQPFPMSSHSFSRFRCHVAVTRSQLPYFFWAPDFSHRHVKLVCYSHSIFYFFRASQEVILGDPTRNGILISDNCTFLQIPIRFHRFWWCLLSLVRLLNLLKLLQPFPNTEQACLLIEIVVFFFLNTLVKGHSPLESSVLI